MTQPADIFREIASRPTTRPKLAVTLRDFADKCELVGVRDMEEAVLFAVGMIEQAERRVSR